MKYDERLSMVVRLSLGSMKHDPAWSSLFSFKRCLLRLTALQPRRHSLALLCPPASFRRSLPRQIQRCLAILALRLDVSASLLHPKPSWLQVVLRCNVSGGLPDQKLDCFQMPVLDHKAQQHQSPLVLRLDVGGSLLDQNFHRFQMSVLSRPSRQCMSLVPLTRRQRGLPAAASQFSNVLLEPPYERQIAHHNFALHPGTVGSILVLTIPLI